MKAWMSYLIWSYLIYFWTNKTKRLKDLSIFFKSQKTEFWSFFSHETMEKDERSQVLRYKLIGWRWGVNKILQFALFGIIGFGSPKVMFLKAFVNKFPKKSQTTLVSTGSSLTKKGKK